jgi:hypothetical protein
MFCVASVVLFDNKDALVILAERNDENNRRLFSNTSRHLTFFEVECMHQHIFGSRLTSGNNF